MSSKDKKISFIMMIFFWKFFLKKLSHLPRNRNIESKSMFLFSVWTFSDLPTIFFEKTRHNSTAQSNISFVDAARAAWIKAVIFCPWDVIRYRCWPGNFRISPWLRIRRTKRVTASESCFLLLFPWYRFENRQKECSNFSRLRCYCISRIKNVTKLENRLLLWQKILMEPR